MKPFSELLKESTEGNTIKAYHGTRSFLPFERFNKRMDGSGLVNPSGKKFGGFFFTSEFENAQFYTEWFVAEVKINNVFVFPEESRSPTVLKTGIQQNKIYQLEDVLDGQIVSDITVVPNSLLENIQILKWHFVSEKEFLFESLDDLFNSDEEDDYINKDMIYDTLEMMDMDVNFLLTIPIIKEYIDQY